MRRARRVATPALALLLALAGTLQGVLHGSATPAPFAVGAASVDVTPPPRSAATDAAFTPLCGGTAAQVAARWPGARPFAFEEPYIDRLGTGRYAPGDPYCDANHNGRYEAPYLAGGDGANRWPTAADPGNPVAAQAVVLVSGTQHVALVSVDSIGLFNVTANAIRSRAAAYDAGITDVHVASTHDESAPDPIGLWGPDTTDTLGSNPLPVGVVSGVDAYYMSWLADRAGHAVAQADAAARPASLRFAVAGLPGNVQSCWSSYPFIDDQRIPVMQAVDGAGQVIATVVNGQTHVETLAFSDSPAYQTMLSGDWPGRMRAHLAAQWPGSVAMELTGLIGSVETPTVYEPSTVQVVDVPGALHNVAGNPDRCRSVYPEPAGGTPVSDAHQFLEAYGAAMADDAVAALATADPAAIPDRLLTQRQSICVQLENQLFVAAFAAHLFPQRPAYADPLCTVGVVTFKPAPTGLGEVNEPNELWLKSEVGVLTVGPAQFAFSPGEVFPITEIGGHINPPLMPTPSDRYDVVQHQFGGNPLPHPQWTTPLMSGRYRFLVGLAEDMIGYIMPPANFVGSDQTETQELPWLQYQLANGGTDRDRFGYGHSDDAESPGPHAGLDVTNALAKLLGADGPAGQTDWGYYVDAAKHSSVSPFPSPGFAGAVGVVTVLHGTLLLGRDATGWATFDGGPDRGTPGTAYPYSVSTGGVVLNDGTVLFVDVYGAYFVTRFP